MPSYGGHFVLSYYKMLSLRINLENIDYDHELFLLWENHATCPILNELCFYRNE